MELTKRDQCDSRTNWKSYYPLSGLDVLPLEQPTDDRYAELRTALEQAGTTIGSNDMFIAAHALALGLILVTANVNEFSRVPGLAVENWLV